MAKKRKKIKSSKVEERESNRKAITKTNQGGGGATGKINKRKYNEHLREKELEKHRENSPVKEISVEEYLKIKKEEEKK